MCTFYEIHSGEDSTEEGQLYSLSQFHTPVYNYYNYLLQFNGLIFFVTFFLQSYVTEFYGIELWMLKKAIEALSREGKAELIPGENLDGSDAGVKFFS